MDSAAATPIQLNDDPSTNRHSNLNLNHLGHHHHGHSHGHGAHDHQECRIATPAPTQPPIPGHFSYSSMVNFSNFNPNNNYNSSSANSFTSYLANLSRFGHAHGHGPVLSPFNQTNQNHLTPPLPAPFPSLFPSPNDLFHYGYSPVNGLPATPLTPGSSFWPISGQTYPQIGGLSYSNSPGSLSYAANAHLYNLFSPSSISSLSPNGTDGHSPSFYPRVSSMPSPYSSSPGMPSAFMSPGSLPPLLSPSALTSCGGSSIDRQSSSTTYLNNDDSPTLIKCESNSNEANNLTYSIQTHNERHPDTESKRHERSSQETHKHSDKVVGSKHNGITDVKGLKSGNSLVDKQTNKSLQFSPTKSHQNQKIKEKCSARVEPLMRSDDDQINKINDKINDNEEVDEMKKSNNINGTELNKNHFENENHNCKKNVNNQDESSFVGCYNESHGNCINQTSLSSHQHHHHVKEKKFKKVVKQESSDSSLPSSDVVLVPKETKLKIDSTESCSSFSSSDVHVKNLSESTTSGLNVDDKQKDDDKNAKKESLKQLQSFRKDNSHRNSPSNHSNESESNEKDEQQQTRAAIVHPKQDDTKSILHKDKFNEEGKIKKDIKSQLSTPNTTTTKQLPKQKQSRLSRKHSSSSIPVGIAIAQQRITPKSNNNNHLKQNDVASTQQQQPPLKPILPTLQLPVVNSPILITDSPPAGTSLWIKPTGTSIPSTSSSSSSTPTSTGVSNVHPTSVFSGDYHLARDSITGQLYLIRNSSSLPSTPTASKPPTITTLKSNEQVNDLKLNEPSAILTMPTLGPSVPSTQFFANLTTPSLILDPSMNSANNSPTTFFNLGSNQTTFQQSKTMPTYQFENHNNYSRENNLLNVERGIQACISDDETLNMNEIHMKTTSIQVDMDQIHSSEDDDENEGKRFKLSMKIHQQNRLSTSTRCTTDDDDDDDDDDEDSRDSIHLQIVDSEKDGDEVLPPVLPVKSSPVMEFIDHHGLDLLVDSIEEFAAREEAASAQQQDNNDVVDGLQLLSALAEQRSREERGNSKSPPRRHSTDTFYYSSSPNNLLLPVKKRQRSESCYDSTSLLAPTNAEPSINSPQKRMKTSGSQTSDIYFDKKFVCQPENDKKSQIKKPFAMDNKKTDNKQTDNKQTDDKQTDDKQTDKTGKKSSPEIKMKIFKKKDELSKMKKNAKSFTSKIINDKDDKESLDDPFAFKIENDICDNEKFDLKRSDGSKRKFDDKFIKSKESRKKVKFDGNKNKEASKTKEETKIKEADDGKSKVVNKRKMKLLDDIIDEIISRPLTPDQREQVKDVNQKEEEDKVKQDEIENEDKMTEDSQTESSQMTTSSATTNSQITILSLASSYEEISLHLMAKDLDVKNVNVIMLVDGFLYVGEICPIQAPDIYGIILHGERQHRPHIYSQEEMLKEAIREIKVDSPDQLKEGQRVCAFWSTQYRHLYPGFIRMSTPHPTLVYVEFDDGDSGRIPIDDIRLLPQDYPLMKINADPMKILDRKRRTSSCSKSDLNNKKSGEKENMQNEKPNDIVSKCQVADVPCQSVRVKKKKKHTKDDRHHRHHKHHHHTCSRHHRKCKKHKSKSKDPEPRITKLNNKESKKESIKEGKKGMNKATSNQTNKLTNGIQKMNNKDDENAQKFKCKELSSSNSKPKASSNSLSSTSQSRIASSLNDSSTNNDKKKAKRICDTKTNTTANGQNELSNTKSPSKKSSKEKESEIELSSQNSTSQRRRERNPSSEKSKIAAFLPERQLWHWAGRVLKKTGCKGSRTRKVFYKEIERGREKIKIDDCAVFLSTGRPHLPFIGRIDSMWQTGSGNMMVKVRWFYHPEETKGNSVPLVDKRGALFESSHFDVNDVQTISHKCQVISWQEYQLRKKENLIVLDDPPNVYYLAGQYDALNGRIKMETNVPLKEKQSKD